MNKNEPIIINQASSGYLIKPLSYMFNDEVGEDAFEVFSNLKDLNVWMVDHFELVPAKPHTPTSKPHIKVKPEIEQTQRTHTGEVVGGGANGGRTKPRSPSTSKK